MKLLSGDVRALEKLLVDEIALSDEYIKVIQQEQAAVVKLNAVLVTSLTEMRAMLVDKLARVREDRLLLIERITGSDSSRVSDVIKERCGPVDKKRLLALTDKLRIRLEKIERCTNEFSQVVSFSLGLVNGEISLLWSATQPVTRVYNAHGGMTEAVQPGPARLGSSLGKA